MNKYILFLSFSFFTFFTACKVDQSEIMTQAAAEVVPELPSTQADFWKNLAKLCDNAYAGKIVNGSPNDTAFNGKALIMHVRSCGDDVIRIPFFVGSDSSRTWVITKTTTGLQLKHDHRHMDGAPDSVTMYGGHTSNGGSANRQLFPADQETAELLPLAIGNIWWIDIVPDSIFTYNLRRVNTDRLFSVEFDLTKPLAEKPSKPWGWKD
jgi:hypothetical protein